MGKMEKFKAMIGPVAAAVERETGINAKLGMGQAAHESGYGASGLSSPDSKLEIRIDAPGTPPYNSTVLRIGPANNFFGFTAELGTYWRSQNRPYVLMPTTEWKDGKPYKTTRPFRAYSSPEESYRDWARLMQTPAYVKAGAPVALKAGDVAGFAEAMRKVGYATDPTYAAKLVRVISGFDSVA